MSEAFERTILLVDRDLDYLDWATKHLAAAEVRILRCNSSDNAEKVCEKVSVDLVIADMQLEPFDGIELLKRLKVRQPGIVVILTAGFPGTGQIIKASQAGAQDILGKEALTFELRPAVEEAFRTLEALRKTAQMPTLITSTDGRAKIIGNSRAFQNVFKMVGRVARTDAPVLIYGESGTGKELVATSIHEYSDRRQNELVAINCGAIPENLLESELFGHEKGSFTGAAARRVGRFEQCNNGTLFLDEIGDMPLQVQVKLLRVLQEGTFSRVGSNETLHSDVRIIAATNKNLAEEVVAGNFREDLYYRLNVVELNLPPLRDRKEDIPLLAEFFLQKITRKNGMARLRLSGEAAAFLQQHRWPGNVRELENTMARACALASSDTLLPRDIPIGVSLRRTISEESLFESFLEIRTPGSCAITEMIERFAYYVVDKNEGNLSFAAQELGCSLVDLKRYLRINQALTKL
jgi:DNA-binding NtrC family response regulator